MADEKPFFTYRLLRTFLLVIGGLFVAFIALVGYEVSRPETMRLPSQSSASIDAMSEDRRNIVLRMAIQDADKRCPEVTRSFKSGEYDASGLSLWSAECYQGIDLSGREIERIRYVVSFERDGGSAKVLDCWVYRATTRLACFEPFK